MRDSSQDGERREVSLARPWSTPAQVAEYFQVSAATVYARIHSGEWECTKLGSRIYRFSAEQIAKIEAGVTTPTHAPRDRAALRLALKKMT